LNTRLLNIIKFIYGQNGAKGKNLRSRESIMINHESTGDCS